MGGWGEEALDSKSPFMIGKTLMASMMTGLDKDKVLGYLWADGAREISVDGSPMEFIKRTRTKGGGTNLGKAMKHLIDSKTFVDKIVIFTDMQQNYFGYSEWNGRSADTVSEMIKNYRKINPNVKVLYWNLQGYGGGTPMKLTHSILEVGGYSDKMLSVIPKMWKNKDALIDEINAVVL